jgi:hypothetical protein
MKPYLHKYCLGFMVEVPIDTTYLQIGKREDPTLKRTE